MMKYGHLMFDGKGDVCDGEGGVYGVVSVADIAHLVSIIGGVPAMGIETRDSAGMLAPGA